MATRSKPPSTPAKRSKNTAVDAPAKARAQRNGGAKQPEAPSAPMASADTAAPEQTFEAPANIVERQPAARASVGREDRTSRALDAIRTLGEMIAEGIGTLAELRSEVREISGRLDQLAAGQQSGVHRPEAAVTPPTLSAETDATTLQSPEEPPKRAGRGKRGSQA